MTDDRAAVARIAANRERQRELYGAPLGERIRRVTAALGITQGRLARGLGLSPAMLSQLVSGRRVKIGDPAVLARLLELDARCAASGPEVPEPAQVETLLEEVSRARPDWALAHRGGARAGGVAGEPAGDAPLGTPICSCRSAAAPPPVTQPVVSAAGVSPSGVPQPVVSALPVPRRPPAPPTAADALRRVTGPARLVAAAAALDPAFPELADVLRHAAAHGR